MLPPVLNGPGAAIDLPSGVVVQASNWLDPILDCLSCTVEVARPVEDRSLNTTAAIVTHDDDVADVEVRHAVREGGDGVAVPVLIRNVASGEKSTRGSIKDSSFRNPRVTVWGDSTSAASPSSQRATGPYLHPRKIYGGCCPLVVSCWRRLGLLDDAMSWRNLLFPSTRGPNSGN